MAMGYASHKSSEDKRIVQIIPGQILASLLDYKDKENNCKHSITKSGLSIKKKKLNWY